MSVSSQSSMPSACMLVTYDNGQRLSGISAAFEWCACQQQLAAHCCLCFSRPMVGKAWGLYWNLLSVLHPAFFISFSL